MPSTFILAMALAGPLPMGPSAGAAGLKTPEDLRAAYRDAMQQSAKRARPDYVEVVPRVAGLYVELAAAEGFSHSERSQLRDRLKVRLEEVRDRLLRAQVAAQRSAARTRYRSQADPDSTASRTAPATAAGGDVAARNAQQLIDLIQNTIAPESWEVNGGRGSIRYYTLYHALVVRQTAEVHHQLGDGVRQLRKAR